ncbi:hypothetical protein A3K69_07500 [Candidatus Bathyarchaeota archaeon RBG_16_57_9]|nr:MAG: hypothetical protein A3K69_07500 [Candidatus Bathyarchaeota archaeon RBG_16_57_9]
MICLRVYSRGGETLLAACDKDVLGKTFKGKGLKITVSEGFYRGEDADEETLVNRLQLATVANLVGERTLEIAIRHGFVDSDCVMDIGGVPHAQMARMM